MRKIILLIITAIGIMVLAACGANHVEPDETAYYQDLIYQEQKPQGPAVEFKIQINIADDDFLSTFDYIHEADYNDFFAIRDGDDHEPVKGDRLVLWANQPVTDFAVILFTNDFIDDEWIFIPLESFGLIPQLRPGEAFVVNNYRGLGTLPWSGVTFVDENGRQRYFAMDHNQAYPYGSGNVIDIWEFENRVHELPDDWDYEPHESNPEPTVAMPCSGLRTPCPELRAILLEQSGISEYGWQVAADFLKDFTSMFVEVARAETTWCTVGHTDAPAALTGRFWRWSSANDWRPVATYELPGISYASLDGYSITFFDKYGNQIYDAIWKHGEHYAHYFKLYDFDNSGIPDIVINFAQTFEGCYGGFRSIFRYIDGEYRELETLAFADGEQLLFGGGLTSVHELFLDDNGRIIVRGTSWPVELEYNHLIFTNNRAEFHRIVDDGNNWEAWHEHHWQIWSYGYHEVADSWLFHSPTIFGTDIPITPLHPFTDLGAELSVYLWHQRQ